MNLTRNLFIPFYRIPTRLVILMAVAMGVLAIYDLVKYLLIGVSS